MPLHVSWQRQAAPRHRKCTWLGAAGNPYTYSVPSCGRIRRSRAYFDAFEPRCLTSPPPLAAPAPQIFKNVAAGSTGALSSLTTFINVVGCIVRIFTTQQAGGGAAMMRGYVVSECRGGERTRACVCGGGGASGSRARRRLGVDAVRVTMPGSCYRLQPYFSTRPYSPSLNTMNVIPPSDDLNRPARPLCQA
mgnify:CR=1 FL=1